MNPVVDFRGAGDFKTVPDGIYVAKCLGFEEAVSKNGKDMLVWEFEITEGKHKGTKLKDWSVIENPFGSFLIIKALTGEEMDGEQDIDGDDYAGLDCVIVVTTKEIDGKDRNNIERVEPFDPTKKTPRKSASKGASKGASKKKGVPKRKVPKRKPSY